MKFRNEIFKMKKRREHSIETRGKIQILSEEGYTHREIAKRLKIPRTSVTSILRRYREVGTNETKKRSGRPRCTSTSEDKHIIVMSKRNRRLPATAIKEDLNKTRKCPLSVDTVKRRLRDAGLYGRVACRKPLLRNVNKVKRLQWAKKHRNWSLDQWRKVFWTDESKFELFGTKRRLYVRRKVGERVLENCVAHTVKHGGGHVMIWGGFGGGKVGDLVRITSIMDKKMYHNILVRHAVPSGIRNIGKGFVFQQDNDPKHTSKLCVNYIKSKEEQNVLKFMTWAPQSPDLNPIEKLWDELDRKVRVMAPSNVEALWACLHSAWENISTETLEKLVSRMPQLCEAVIRAKGGHIDESKI